MSLLFEREKLFEKERVWNFGTSDHELYEFIIICVTVSSRCPSQGSGPHYTRHFTHSEKIFPSPQKSYNQTTV